MRINTSKQIFLIILLLMPVILSAQVGQRKYITRSGDTTIVVNTGSTGLRGEDASFLLDEDATERFIDKRSRYSRLRDAVLETNQTASIVDVEQKTMNPSTGSLGFRISQQNIRYLQREKEAEKLAQSRINRDATVEEMAYLLEKFGNKPSYFVNGIAVDPNVAASISRKDILTQETKVRNTATGNPNGEIWYVLTSQAFDRLDLGVSYAANRKEESPLAPKYGEQQSQDLPSDFWDEPSTASATSSNIDRSTLTPEQREKLSKQEQEIEELRRAIQGYGKEPVVTSPTIYPATQQQPYYPAENTETRVMSRKVGNRFVDDEIVSFKDSPQEKARRARDRQESIFEDANRGYEEDVIQVTNQALDSEITKDTPKRSIRRIKERQRNQ